jgi:hypothetical protein
MLPDRLCRILTAYVDGELSSRQQEAVLELVRQSPEARALLRQLQEDAGQIRDLPAHKLEPEFTERVLGQLSRGPVRPVIRYDHPAVGTPLHIGIGLATAASLLLVVGLGSYYFLKIGQVQPAAQPELAETLPSDRANPNGVPSNDPKEKANGPAPSVDPGPTPSPAPSTAKLVDRTPPKPAPSPSNAPGSDLTNPNVKPELITPVDIQVPFTLLPRELTQDKVDSLLKQLQKRRAQRLEFQCRQTALGVSAVQAALEAQGVRVLLDRTANMELEAAKLGLPSKMDYAIYAEDVSAEEIVKIVQDIAANDRKGPSRHGGSRLFGGLSVNPPTDQEVKDLTKLLGFNPLKPDLDKSAKPDPRKPLADATANQVLDILKGRGKSRPEAGRAAMPDRLAVVLACTSRTPPSDSKEIQLFRNHRKELKDGRLQVLLLVRRP